MRDLEIDDFTAYCRRIGMTGTTHRTRLPPVGLPADHPLEAVTTTTSADQVRLLDLILRGTTDAEAAEVLGVTPALCRLAIQFLQGQRYRNMIPAQLPRNTVVANKTGWGPRGFMDAAIVYRDGAPLYIMSALTDHVPNALPDGSSGEAAAMDAVARVSRATWDALI
jgi:beta-lactamase class A